MYRFKKEKYHELLDGRKEIWLAEKLGYSIQMLSYIFNNKRDCRKMVAYAIVQALHPECEIEDFFEYIEKGE